MTESPPKGLTFSNTIALGLRIPTYEFLSDTHIQFIKPQRKAYYPMWLGIYSIRSVFLLMMTDLSALHIYTLRSEKATSFLAAWGLERVRCG